MGSGAELHHICATSEKKDLGIIFSPDLKFGSHIHKITQNANRVLGVIYCTFKYRDFNIIHHTSLVRPHLKYASNIWNPYLLRHMRATEK